MPINYTYNYPEVARDAGFKLKQYKDGPMDWRVIGSLEIERLLRDQSLEQIDSILEHLCEAPLGGVLETNILDTGIAKYFAISQLSIQYLMFCREFLDETIRDLRDSHASSAIELAQTKKSLTDANNEILQLHRRLTQMEAIHEVVYPCHLCSKSFVNNDSLNIHINRKHGQQLRQSTPDRTSGGGGCGGSGSPHSRDTDVHLINTIKLELEIKQLKERLNVAEREIREKRKTVSPRSDGGSPKATNDIGIQSNLSEAKEKDSGDVDSTDLQERKEQLLALQEKIVDFEEWKESQRVHNAESIAKINRKLEDIALALENAKLTREAEAVGQQQQQSLDTKSSPSVEDLERILMEKVEEIGKASAEKLEEVVYHMENSYKDKLNELEREIKKSNADRERRAAVRKERGDYNETDSSMTDCGADKQTVRMAPNMLKEKTFDIRNEGYRKKSKKLKDKIFGIQNETTKDQNPQLASAKSEMSSTSLESNHTFVKENPEIPEQRPEIFIEPLNLPDPEDESTDVSDSLSEEPEPVNTPYGDEHDDDVDDDDDEVEVAEKSSTSSHSDEDDNEDELRDKLTALERQKREKKPPLKPPRTFTHKDSSRMANARLRPHGLDMKMTELSAVAAKRINSELMEKREKLKQKYPHFFGTRNKIRKFVDKLCSNKLPESAEALLNAMEPFQPLHSLNSLNKRRNLELSDDDEDNEVDVDETNEFAKLEMRQSSSTPLSFTQNPDFKKRLESLLATPLQQPPDYGYANDVATMKPQPLPRKRVMFNTQTNFHLSEIDSNDAEHLADGSEGVPEEGEYDESANEYSDTTRESTGRH